MKLFLFPAIFLSLSFVFQSSTHAASVVDRSFGTNGSTSVSLGNYPQAQKLKIQPDGKILVLAMALGNTVLARFNTDGSLDSGFGANGVSVVSLSDSSETANDIGLQSDGKIIVVGSIYSAVTQSIDFMAARFNANGSLDATFGTNGISTVNQSSTDTFNAVAIQSDNKIVAAGKTSQNRGDFAAIRFNANGELDNSFADSGLYFMDIGQFNFAQEFRAVQVLQSGRILLAGSSLEGGGAEDVYVMLEGSGQGAQDFGTSGVRPVFLGQEQPGTAYDLAILPTGKFISVSRSGIQRRNLSNGDIDPSFRALYTSGGLDIAVGGTDIAVRADGRFLVLNQGGYSLSSTVAYNNDGRDINRVRYQTGVDIAVQSDDKFLIANTTTDGFSLSRFLSITSLATRIADFDYDGKTDPVVVRPDNSIHVLRSLRGIALYQLRLNSDESGKVIPEDYFSYDPSQFPLFYWRYSLPNTQAYFDSITERSFLATTPWGLSTDIPVGGDYDGETRVSMSLFRKSSEPAVFRPSDGFWWIFNRTSNAVSCIQWGMAGDKPVPADYDYDGITDVAVFRPSTGVWWIRRSTDGGVFAVQFGIETDIPLTGDFDGDGKADQTVFRPSEGIWYQNLSTEGFKVTRFGLATDVPVPGDYDGDGKHDIAVFRDGIWYLLQSSLGFSAVQWGNPTDSPVSVRYDR